MEQGCALLYARKTGVLVTGDEEAGIGVSSCMSDSVMKQVRSQLRFGVTAHRNLEIVAEKCKQFPCISQRG